MPDVAQPLHDLGRTLGVAHRNRFRDLEFERLRIEAGRI